MERNVLFSAIKHAVHQMDKNAQIILYGSRARGDAQADSDWDVLILLSRPMNRIERTHLRHALYDVELETDEILNMLLENFTDWHSEKNRYSPFYKNVTREGIQL